MDSVIAFVTTNISDVFNYMVAIQLHPAVMIIIFLCLFLVRIRFELPIIELAKAEAVLAAEKPMPESVEHVKLQKMYDEKATKIGNNTLYVAFGLSILGQMAFYFPRTMQGILICLFMSIGQVAIPSITNYYVEKWGLMELIGKKIKAKAGD